MKTVQELEQEIKQLEQQYALELGKRLGMIELLKEQETKKDDVLPNKSKS
jgi:hypothetical protein